MDLIARVFLLCMKMQCRSAGRAAHAGNQKEMASFYGAREWMAKPKWFSVGGKNQLNSI